MSASIYQIIHLVSILVLFGGTFYAFAAPIETKKKVMMATGIASLLILISGFGLMSKLYANQFQPWMVVKIVCWLALSALAGIGYRKRGSAGKLAVIVTLIAAIAIVTVYYVRFRA